MENYDSRSDHEMTMGEWMLTLIISSIPFVGIISLLMWAFSRSTPVCKANWAKAWLLLQVIGYVAVILMWGTLISVFQMGLFD
ncbi:MAG: hypothetical protein K9M99_06595 [Candidatus Cloacimonetes bacterium]|nr:hypothetical protein [Candidatus Cloacimonadota bacterium]